MHWRSTKNELAPEFWVLVECLEEMHRRWHGHLQSNSNPVADSATSFFKQLALRLHALWERCLREPDLVIDVSGQFEDTAWEEEDTLVVLRQHKHPDDRVFQALEQQSRVEPANSFVLSPSMEWPGYGARETLSIQPDELSATTQGFMEQQYMNMDRVISFEDVMHAGPARSATDGNNGIAGGGWDGTQQQQPTRGPAMDDGHGRDAIDSWQSR